MINWSYRQKAIFEAYENTRNNIVICATAGSSKTTCIVECARRTPFHKKALFMAFNKSIAEELRERLPQHIKVNTYHAQGLNVLFSHFKFQMKLNENKTFILAKSILNLKEMPYKSQLRYLFDLQNIWTSLRVGLLVNYEEDIPNICIDKDIEYQDRMIEDIKDIENEWIRQANKIQNNKNFIMDFTDMLYLPYILIDESEFPKFDIVFSDENQDCNTLQRELLLQYVKPKFGRFVCVGDKNQMIYQFQNASLSNFLSFSEFPNTVTLPLDITYRCSKKIVEEARKVFSEGIEAAPDAKEGIVRKGDLREATSGDFVLCRNNLPLIEAFITLLEEGKKSTIKGKEFGEALLSILEKINYIDDLDVLKHEKVEKIMKDKNISYQTAIQNQSYQNLVEKCSILEKLYCVWNDLDTLKSKVQTIYSEKTEGIILSTIHKSKGLEADRVFFLNQNLIPSQYVTTQEALYSEYCLKFVAITRARNELIYCSI